MYILMDKEKSARARRLMPQSFRLLPKLKLLHFPRRGFRQLTEHDRFRDVVLGEILPTIGNNLLGGDLPG